MDNLYLDMNGIVHPCSHPEDRPPPETEEEMMLEVFKYTDRVVNMVRPRKVLMIAVGMCPLYLLDATYLAKWALRWCRASCEDESAEITPFQVGTGSSRKGGRHGGADEATGETKGEKD